MPEETTTNVGEEIDKTVSQELSKQTSRQTEEPTDLGELSTITVGEGLKVLAETKINSFKDTEIPNVILTAERIIQNPTPVITEKEVTPPSGDRRDYISFSPYVWETNDGKLEYRDGQINPKARELSDSGKLDQAITSIFVTSFAAEATSGRELKAKVAHYASETLSRWFVDEKTRMTPNFEYAQMRPGETTGNFYGIIDGSGLINVVIAVQHLDREGLIDPVTKEGVRKWFEQYLEWLRASEKGLREKDMPNNHGTFYDVQIAYIADFLGEEDVVKETLDSTKKRIATQIEPSGEMPEESRRETAYDYEIFNLQALAQLAILGQKYDENLWTYTQDGRCLEKAFSYFANRLNKAKQAGINPFHFNRAGALFQAFRAASLAYGNESYWNLPRAYIDNLMVDQLSARMLAEG